MMMPPSSQLLGATAAWSQPDLNMAAVPHNVAVPIPWPCGRLRRRFGGGFCGRLRGSFRGRFRGRLCGMTMEHTD